MMCPACKSENTFKALVDGTYYRGPILACQDCNRTFGRGGKPLAEIEKALRQAEADKRRQRRG